MFTEVTPLPTRSHRSKAFVRAVRIGLAVSLLSVPSLFADEDREIADSVSFSGQVCHGANNFNGQRLSDFSNVECILPHPLFAFWTQLKVQEVGVFDAGPGARNSLPIDAATPLKAKLATHCDEGSGLVPQAVCDARIEEYNVKIHRPFSVAEQFTGTRLQLPRASVADKLTPARNTEKAVTVKKWNRASGEIELECYEDGTGYVEIEAHDLTPNVAYTVWAVFAVNQPPPSAPDLTGAAVPLGGLPNYFVPDSDGTAEFERSLSFCPLELENPLMYVALFQHWDHSLYGASADGFWQNLPFGLVGSDHLCFTVADYLDTSDPPSDLDSCDGSDSDSDG